MGHSERAIAENEAMFRSLNEMVENVAQQDGERGDVVFLCECGDDLCGEEIRMTVAEYERIRSVPTWFLVRPGHFDPNVEVIVEKEARFWIVRKVGDAADEALDSDPRSP